MINFNEKTILMTIIVVVVVYLWFSTKEAPETFKSNTLVDFEETSKIFGKKNEHVVNARRYKNVVFGI